MDTSLFDELLITHDIWGSEVLSQTSLVTEPSPEYHSCVAAKLISW
jgi:hypothetical protein